MGEKLVLMIFFSKGSDVSMHCLVKKISYYFAHRFGFNVLSTEKVFFAKNLDKAIIALI